MEGDTEQHDDLFRGSADTELCHFGAGAVHCQCSPLSICSLPLPFPRSPAPALPLPPLPRSQPKTPRVDDLLCTGEGGALQCGGGPSRNVRQVRAATPPSCVAAVCVFGQQLYPRVCVCVRAATPTCVCVYVLRSGAIARLAAPARPSSPGARCHGHHSCQRHRLHHRRRHLGRFSALPLLYPTSILNADQMSCKLTVMSRRRCSSQNAPAVPAVGQNDLTARWLAAAGAWPIQYLRPPARLSPAPPWTPLAVSCCVPPRSRIRRCCRGLPRFRRCSATRVEQLVYNRTALTFDHRLRPSAPTIVRSQHSVWVGRTRYMYTLVWGGLHLVGAFAAGPSSR